jgi:hypothetical protein
MNMSIYHMLHILQGSNKGPVTKDGYSLTKLDGTSFTSMRQRLLIHLYDPDSAEK